MSVSDWKNMFIHKIIKNIQHHGLIREGEAVLLGVSGGADSMCLLFVLNRISRDLGFRPVVAHFNHMLRGEESDGDEVFVREQASLLNLPFVAGREDVEAWRRKHGGSREEAARTLRYRFFEEEAQRLGAQKIALGHHADDQAETVLMRMIRGAGPLGLSGIPAMRDGRYIRPLLSVAREEILAYLKENNIPYRDDRSNLATDVLRNKVRLELLPLLAEEYNPRVAGSLGRIAEISREEDDLLRQYTKELLASLLVEAGEEKVILRKSSLREVHPALRRRILREGVERVKGDLRHFSYAHLEDALDLLEEGTAGKSLDWPDGLRVLFSYDTVTITRERKKKWEVDEVSLDVPGEVSFRGRRIIAQLADIREWKRGGGEGETVAWMDQGKIAPPLLVRTRRPGDRFQPLGMKCEKKLKDFLMDRKIPVEERDDIPLLISEGRVVWIGGVAVSEGVKINRDTVQAVKVRME